MRRLQPFLAALLALGMLDTALAQSSRDELMAKGAKQIGAEELKQLLSGKHISGTAFAGTFTIAWSLKPDGSFSGHGQNPQGQWWDDSGRWNVDDKGQLCFQGISRWPGGANGFNACQEWLRLETDFYAVRGGKAMKREVK